VLNKTGPQSIHILRGVRQQQDEPGRFSICSRQAAVVHNLQAIKVKEGFCLIGNQSGTNRVFMLRRTDLKPFVWKNEIGPSSYAQTRGCHNLAFFYKDELSVVDIQGLQHV
ncbi:hypothetical protein, partial [Escherichia sp. WS1088]|uniref:hypothetical protein n=1 Tax=Escherichia sp. WS1088 TaxID=3381922 RepID=UPI00396F6213